ncbi:MAG: hypothetical protein H0T46_09125 [Deltaproteobacteria bacterium]|nr:hypothetical protein [Deltaproteobacteria bacterium]
MIRASILFIALASLATTTACGKKDGDKGGGGAAKAAGPTKLPALNLAIEVPGDVELGDAVMGKGHMLTGADIGAMQVEIAEKPQTLDEAKSDADMYSPKNVKADKLADGWALSFDNTGGAGANYFVEVRRDIDGKTYKCTTTQGDKDRAATVLAACKTLKKG